MGQKDALSEDFMGYDEQLKKQDEMIRPEAIVESIQNLRRNLETLEQSISSSGVFEISKGADGSNDLATEREKSQRSDVAIAIKKLDATICKILGKESSAEYGTFIRGNE